MKHRGLLRMQVSKQSIILYCLSASNNRHGQREINNVRLFQGMSSMKQKLLVELRRNKFEFEGDNDDECVNILSEKYKVGQKEEKCCVRLGKLEEENCNLKIISAILNTTKNSQELIKMRTMIERNHSI